MNKIKLFFPLFFLLLLVYSNYAVGADSSNLAPLSTPVIMQPYTQPSNVPKDFPSIDAFVANVANQCRPNETRASCFVRYTASVGAMTVSGSLQCPTGYVSAVSYGDRTVDSAGNSLSYYESGSYKKVTAAQYDMLRKYNFACSLSSETADSDWVFSDTPPPTYKVVDTYAAGRFKLEGPDGPREFYISGVNKGKHYNLAGCSGVSWCGVRTRYDYVYNYIDCNRPAGFYPTPSPSDALNMPVLNNKFSPSIVVCSKPSVGFQPAP